MRELEGFMVKQLPLLPVETIKGDETLNAALGRFRKGTETLVVLDRNGKVFGADTETAVLRSPGNASGTKIQNIVATVPRIFGNESIMKAARLMIENDSKQLPVFNEQGQITGMVGMESILAEAAKSSIGKEKVMQACSREVITAGEQSSVGEAYNILRERNISHLPIIDRKGMGVGMASMYDLLSKFFSPKTRAKAGDKRHEKMREFNLPVTDFMNYPLDSVFETETVRKAVEKMIEKNISGLAVLDSRNRISGILTKTDVLQHLVRQEKEVPVVTFSYAKGQEIGSIDDIDLAHMKGKVEQFVQKYAAFLRQAQVFVYIKKHKEKTRGMSLYHVRMRLNSPKGLIAAHANGFGMEYAVHNGLDKLKRQLEKKKTRKTVS